MDDDLAIRLPESAKSDFRRGDVPTRLATLATASLIGLGLATAPTAAAAIPSAATVSTATSAPGDKSHVLGVGYFGYKAGRTWSSGLLDARVARNRDARKVVPAWLQSALTARKTTTAPRTAKASKTTAAQGFVCSLNVSVVTLSGGRLRSTTLATCSGAYLYHYVAAEFQRDSWSGWREYTGFGYSDNTATSQQTWNWSAGCNFGGDKNGSYNYRLYALHWAMSSEDDTWHSGAPVWSNYGQKYKCGTGNS